MRGGVAMSALLERDWAAQATWFEGFSDDEDTVPLVPVYRARVSARCVFGLLLGIVALAATGTGLLAPVGVVLGTLAGLVALVCMIAPRRREITGRSLAVLGFMLGLAAAVLGILAMSGRLPWLTSHTNTVSELHDLVDTALPWLRHW